MAAAKNAPRPPAPEFTIEFLDPKTLTPHPLNYKQHTERQKSELSKSLQAFGWLSAPIYNKKTGHLLDGHERRDEALAMGWVPIPVRVVDVPAGVERRILAAFDRIGELRARDDKLLARLLQEVMVADETPPPGYSEAEVDDLLALIETPVELPPEATEAFHADNPFAERAEQQLAQGPYVPHVKLVNLYLSTEQHERVLAQVEALAETYGTANLTDTVVAAIQESWERHHAGAAGAQPPEPAGVAGEGAANSDAGGL
jgi:hypothetical protein